MDVKENERLLRESDQRVTFWDRHGYVPTLEELSVDWEIAVYGMREDDFQNIIHSPVRNKNLIKKGWNYERAS